jgi:lipoprotein-anchoring transpeptidase ErfK/SrfK
MGNSWIMIMDGAIAGENETGDAGLPGFRPEGFNRRSFLIGSAVSVGVLGLAGCMSTDARLRREAAALYGPVPDEKFPIPATDISKVEPKYFRQTVRYESKEAPGTIIVDPANYYVYRIEGEGNATRYGANVGRDGFLWSGEAYVGRKAEWPTWTPPKEMIQREPRAAKYAGGMPGGPDNPLGARTLYLYQDGVYTLYTIYASRYPQTIGTNLTSGCTGLLTQDMVHLYDRTQVDTKVIVLPA